MTTEAPVNGTTDDHEPAEPGEIEDSEDVLDVDQAQEVLPATFDITSYGADYPVDGLVKRMESGDIVVPSFDPAYQGDDVDAFQRRFVWSRPQMDKFIESLLLGLPVPGIFLVRDSSNRLLVLDGQQRLRTLQKFYSGYDGDQRYKLRQAQKPFAGESYSTLEAEDRRRLDDSIIHATILRQESPSGSQNAVYSIFERLNTGGSPLQPQEIRVALYPGPFLQGLSELNDLSAWRDLYGPKSTRLKDHELILRVLAMYENTVVYERPLKGYLNAYLGANQNRELTAITDLGQVFGAAAELLLREVGTRAFRPVRPVNAAVVDSVMVGMMTRIAVGPVTQPDRLADSYDALLSRSDYREAITSSTAAEETVDKRLSAAKAAFAGTP